MSNPLNPGTPWPPPDRTDQRTDHRPGLGSEVGATCGACNLHLGLDRPHVTILRQVEQADGPETWAPVTVLDARVVERLHQACATGPRSTASAAPGMVVDGDMLRDVIADAVPRWITDEAAARIAANALDRAVRAGMTVLHGPTARHRLVEPADAPPAATSSSSPGTRA